MRPKEALASFRVRDGFRIEQVAAEPLVADPMAMAFDARGRLYVVELHGYPEKRRERLGKVRLLTDTDGDGTFDASTVFAEDLGWPSAVICYDGGVFVGCTPDIYFMRDTDGDGVADEKKTIFTGFSAGSPREIAPRLFNSFRWGYDNRIYAASSMNGGIVRRPSQPESAAVDLRRHDFSFDPKTFDLRKESGTAQHGSTFDLRGNRYASRNSDHLQAMIYDWRYADRNPHYAMPHWRQSIAVDGPAAKIFRISPPEPWRVLRTRWRIGGAISGPVEGGGTAFGYFTSATGVTVYRGDAFPHGYVGNAFVGAPANNLIHRKVITFEGAAPVARRAMDEQHREFIASTDNWFRPVQFANGPDGCLYVADMYRETIEVAHAIPESIKEHLDVYSGTDRGRIYRIVPEGFANRPATDLGKLAVKLLVQMLDHANAWHRDTASRLLFERADPNSFQPLDALMTEGRKASGRIHALHLLHSLGRLNRPRLVRGLEDDAPAVRGQAIRLCEPILREGSSPSGPLWATLTSLADDSDARVRFQLALTLGEAKATERTKILAALAAHPENDRWINAAILSSLADGAGNVFAEMVRRRPGELNEFGVELIQLIAKQKDKTGIVQVLELIRHPKSIFDYFRTGFALGEGMKAAKLSIDSHDSGAVFARLLADARRMATNSTARVGAKHTVTAVRTNAVACLAFDRFENVEAALYSLLDLREGEAIQRAAIETLGRFSVERIGENTLHRWSAFTPKLREAALPLMLRRQPYTIALLKAVEAGTVPVHDVPIARRNQLRRHRDKSIQSMALKVFGKVSTASRASIVEKYQPVLKLTGDANRGLKVFDERCRGCHLFNGSGKSVGPDLATVRAWTAEEFLVHILDPNRKVEPNQRTYEIDTKTDESYTGMILRESTGRIEIQAADGVIYGIERSRIASLRSLGLSLMPEGLEENLSLQGMADLISYLKE